jgi:hypothetical protein
MVERFKVRNRVREGMKWKFKNIEERLGEKCENTNKLTEAR